MKIVCIFFGTIWFRELYTLTLMTYLLLRDLLVFYSYMGTVRNESSHEFNYRNNNNS